MVYTDVAAPDMVMAEAKNLPADVVIDHHLNNRVPCEDKLVVPEAAATGEIIFRLLSARGVSLDADIAKALYIAVSTDTGCFAFDNTTPETHRIASELLRFDFDAGGVNRTYFQEKTFAALRLQAELICGMRLFAEDRIAAVYVPMSLRRDLGITEEDLEDVSSLARSVAGVDAGVTLRELEDESGWKISLRTSTAVNAAEICALFGGGGHARAAGCTLSGTAEKVTEQIVAAIEKTLKAR
ncbi:MAG: hypothetical protein IKL89_05055 [Clostridia bacterium]|nr:hypothetical protein [Clostridia bacterium]